MDNSFSGRRYLAFLLLIVFLIPACKNSEDDPIPEPTGEYERYFEQTGCHPLNPELIDRFFLYVDSVNDVRYLYGSKNQGEATVFWVAKFSSEGTCVWETLHQDKKHSSRAHDFHLLSNGNILLANVKEKPHNSIELYESSPVIVSAEDGKIKKLVEVFDGYFYSDVYLFEDFFFCDINFHELVLLPMARKWAVQVDNEGNIIRQATNLTIPTGKTLFLNDSTYIEASVKEIKKAYVTPDKPAAWVQPITLPAFEKSSIAVTLVEDKVKVVYRLIAGQKEMEETYTLFLETGKPPVKVADIKISPEKRKVNVGGEYGLKVIFTPDNASNRNVVWTSSNEQIATVDENGMVKGISEGKCSIKAISADGGYESSCEINVVSIYELTELSFEQAVIQLFPTKSYQLQPLKTPSTALVDGLQWNSSDDNIVKVDQNGLVEAIKPGVAVISVKTADGEFEATCKIQVNNIVDVNKSISSAVIIGGYVNAFVVYYIGNSSDEDIILNDVYVVDGWTDNRVAQMDPSQLGTMPAHTSISVSTTLNNVFLPCLIVKYKYNGKDFEKRLYWQ